MINIKCFLIDIEKDQSIWAIIIDPRDRPRSTQARIRCKIKNEKDFLYIARNRKHIGRIKLKGHFENDSTMQVEEIEIL